MGSILVTPSWKDRIVILGPQILPCKKSSTALTICQRTIQQLILAVRMPLGVWYLTEYASRRRDLLFTMTMFFHCRCRKGRCGRWACPLTGTYRPVPAPANPPSHNPFARFRPTLARLSQKLSLSLPLSEMRRGKSSSNPHLPRRGGLVAPSMEACASRGTGGPAFAQSPPPTGKRPQSQCTPMHE